MSLTSGRMVGSLKEQLLQDERDKQVELEAIAKAKVHPKKHKDALPLTTNY